MLAAAAWPELDTAAPKSSAVLPAPKQRLVMEHDETLVAPLIVSVLLLAFVLHLESCLHRLLLQSPMGICAGSMPGMSCVHA